MKSFSLDIHTALEQAPIIYADEHQEAAHNAALVRAVGINTAPDTATIDCGVGERPITSGNSIVVSTLGELAVLQQQFMAEVGFTSRSWRAYHASVIQHEGSHAHAAEQLGAGRVLFGLQVWRRYPTRSASEFEIEWNVATRAVDFVTTKLGFAATFAHPIDPSDHDMYSIYDLGYSGIEELGSRITEHNNINPKSIPLPLGYRNRRKVYAPLLGRIIPRF